MSTRHFRKLYGKSSLPPADDVSDDDYEPPYARNITSMYNGLVLSSGSEPESPVASEEEPEAIIQPIPKKQKSKKKRGKGKSINKKDGATEEMDEIDKSLMEVNALLGAPPPAASTSTEKSKTSPYPDIMKIARTHLNVNFELKRLFGPSTSENNRRPRNEIYLHLLLKRVFILPMNDTVIYDYKNKNGVSMSINRRENDIIYFTYDHSLERQRFHREYLKLSKQRDTAALISLDETRSNMHVEGFLELTDALFRMEEYSLANEIIENVIAFMQYIGHPSFNLTSGNVRLEYKFWENRPFHVAVLKYIYLLTNKACHRTALELAKALLNLDPGDPLAVLFIIDTLALRAREHEWLISAIKYFDSLREANLLFNMQYSRALAEFHVANKNKRDTKEADIYLQEAILAYPMVVTKILEFANIHNARINSHELFAKEPSSFATDGLNVLMFIYAKLTYSRFREPTVLDWFLRNATEVAENYTNNEDIKAHAKEMCRRRHGLFQMWPPEVMRHLGVIKHMAPLIFETSLPRFDRQTCGWDPLQDGGINRYGYRTLINPPFDVGPTGSTLYRFFTSMLPSFNVNEPPVDD